MSTNEDLNLVATLAGAVNAENNNYDRNTQDQMGQSVNPNTIAPISEQDLTGSQLAEAYPMESNSELEQAMREMGSMPIQTPNVAQPMRTRTPSQSISNGDETMPFNLQSEIYQSLIKNNLLLEKVFDLVYTSINGIDNSSEQK